MAQTATNATTTVATLNMILMFLFGVSLKAIWSVLNILQIIVYFTEVKANLAPQTVSLLTILKTIALFQFIPYEWATDYLKSMYDDKFV